MTSHGPTHVEQPPLVIDPEEEDYESLPTTSLKVQLLAGAIAGIAEHTIVYPIDAIKVSFHFPSKVGVGADFCRLECR